MTADPAQVVVAEGGAGDDEEPILAEPSHGEVALDPAVLVEHVRVGDATDGAVHVVGAQPLQESEGTRAADLDLGEARLVEERGGPAGGEALRTDGRRPVLAGPTARPEAGVTSCSVRF